MAFNKKLQAILKGTKKHSLKIQQKASEIDPDVAETLELSGRELKNI